MADLDALSKSQRQSAELGLALTLEGLKDVRGAADAARRVIALDRKSGNALHAKVIIAEQIKDATERSAELQRLLVTAHKGRHTVVENNIRLTLASAEKDDEKASGLLKEVVQTPVGCNDFYNGVRAAVQLAERRSRSSGLTEVERSRLIDAYHFLYSERLVSLFDRCHEALWNEFEHSGQMVNLLNLFRHSSFIWRLNGHKSTEARYLAKLVGMVQAETATRSRPPPSPRPSRSASRPRPSGPDNRPCPRPPARGSYGPGSDGPTAHRGKPPQGRQSNRRKSSSLGSIRRSLHTNNRSPRRQPLRAPSRKRERLGTLGK